MADKHINDELWDTRKTVKLGDTLNHIYGGGTPSRMVEEYWNGNIPWCTVKDFDGSVAILDTQEYISSRGLKESSAKLIPKGNLILPTRMSLGKVAINHIDIAINQDLKACIPKKEFDVTFLYYAYTSISERVKKLGSGSTVAGISLDELKNLKIHSYDIDIQIKIGKFLSSIDDLIEQSSKLEKLYISTRESYMQLIFNKDPQLRYLNSNKDFKTLPLSHFFEKQVNTIMVQDNEMYQQVTISNDGIVSSRKHIDGSKIGRKRQFKIDLEQYPNTLTFIRQGIYNGGIGFIKDKSLDGAIVTENMPLLTLSDEMDATFFSEFLKSGYYRRNVLFNLKPTGSAQSAIHEKDWLKQKITIPSKEEQVKIANFLSSLNDLIEYQTKTTSEYKLLKQHYLNIIFK